MAKLVSVLLCQPRLIIVLLEAGFFGCVLVVNFLLFSTTAVKIVQAVKERNGSN